MTNFTPGPSQLYFTVQDHLKKAFREGIPSLSHRSKQFEAFFIETTESLRALLNLPSNYSIAFTASATETWERIIQNLVKQKSHHLVNGAFSARFFEVAQQLQRTATKTSVNPGEGFTDLSVPPGTELVALTHNETSTGVSLPPALIDSFRKKNPEHLVAVDAVSSLPYPDIDYQLIDTVFFSVQKGFGLPAGLGVWLFNERCLEKAEQLLRSGLSIGSYHSILSLHEFAKKNQTPETPNVLAIYLLGKVVQDFLRKGLQAIRKETEYKAATLYQSLDRHPSLKAFVTAKENRSATVIVVDCGKRCNEFSTLLKAKGLYPGEGYGDFRKSQLRFANFPAHSKEEFECLADLIDSFQ